MKICHRAPSVSHLLFADDSLLLVKANRENAVQIQRILEMYEQVSGQTINKDKSAVMFSTNARDIDRAEVKGILQMPLVQKKGILQIAKETMNDSYLGLPVHVGKSRTATFSYLKDRVWQRIQGSKEKMLSRASYLIKVVAQAIPTFVMGCFDLSKNSL